MAATQLSRTVSWLRTCAIIANVLIGLFVLVGLVVTLVALKFAVTEIRTGFGFSNAQQPVMALALAAAMIPATLGLTVWVWRAHANLHLDQRDGLSYRAPWAALSLWVPLANLFVPKSAMRQLWNHSHGEEPWFANQSVEAVNAWWTCFMAGIVVLIVLTAIMLFDTMTAFVWVTPPGTNMLAMAVASALLTGSGWLLIDIIDQVTVAQARFVSKES